MAKSQWDIVTRGNLFATDPNHKAHKVKTKVKFIEFGVKKRRPGKGPDGLPLMMTDIEWATYSVQRKQGATAYAKCRCHGACECFAKKPQDIDAAVKQAEATKRPFTIITQYGVTRIKFLDITEADMVESSVPTKTVHDLRKK